MKRILIPILALSFSILACSIQIPVTPTQQPVVTEPPADVTAPPPPTDLPVLTNTVCNELSLYLDPALASGYTCETIPESSEMMEIYPQHTKLTFQGYLLADKFFLPNISIYPVQRFTELMPDFIPERIASLSSLLAGSPPVDNSLPFLPVFNAAQVFHAQYRVLPFSGGSGIRYLTLFAQYSAPINNHDLFYTYQGITNDGNYWISAVLPINHAMLPDNGDNPPNGMSWEDFGNGYETYISDITAQLNAQPADAFSPTLLILDLLVGSITIGQ